MKSETHMARILIVEDELDIVVSLEEDLRRQGLSPRSRVTARRRCSRESRWMGRDPSRRDAPQDRRLRCVRRASASWRHHANHHAHGTDARGGKELGLDSGADDYVTHRSVSASCGLEFGCSFDGTRQLKDHGNSVSGTVRSTSIARRSRAAASASS